MLQRISTIALCGAVGLTASCGSDQAAMGAGGAVGTGGAAGTGGAFSGGRECTASNTTLAPRDGLIANFMDADGGFNLVNGRILTFGSPDLLTYSTSDGHLHVTGNILATSQMQFPNVILDFGDCIDATAFSGVQFSVSGSFSGCTMQYASGDVEHQDATTGAAHATGSPGSYQPQTTIPAGQLTTAPQTLKMPFASPSMPGKPPTPLDKGKLIFVLWQFPIPAAVGDAAISCAVDITIDDVRLY